MTEHTTADLAWFVDNGLDPTDFHPRVHAQSCRHCGLETRNRGGHCDRHFQFPTGGQNIPSRRDDVLAALRSVGRGVTVTRLTFMVSCDLSTIRKHLKSLELEGLALRRSQGGGRPQVWSAVMADA